jgi:hypothetical protein
MTDGSADADRGGGDSIILLMMSYKVNNARLEKKGFTQILSYIFSHRFLSMARDRIELSTQGFSVPCSTN